MNLQLSLCKADDLLLSQGHEEQSTASYYSPFVFQERPMWSQQVQGAKTLILQAGVGGLAEVLLLISRMASYHC